MRAKFLQHIVSRVDSFGRAVQPLARHGEVAGVIIYFNSGLPACDQRQVKLYILAGRERASATQPDFAAIAARRNLTI